MKHFISDFLKTLGKGLLRYGLGLVVIWLGILKFKNFEAEYLRDLISETFLLSWVLKVVTPYVLSQILAYVQIVAGVFILIKPLSRKLSFWGSFLAVVMFVVSISLLFSTEIVWQTGYGFPELSKAGQSILKDFVLLGAACWCVGDSM